MTKQKTWTGIKICCYVALVFCALWALFYGLSFVGLLTGKGGMHPTVDWSRRTALKVVFFVVDLSSLAITIGLCVKAALCFLKGCRKQVVFPKDNVRRFFWLALTYFVHRLCWSNHPFYYKEEFLFGFGHTIVVVPFCILFFAFMYKIAADAVEENTLTI